MWVGSDLAMDSSSSAIPAKAGIQGRRPRLSPWIPAFQAVRELGGGFV
jgi:hypothetical protein